MAKEYSRTQRIGDQMQRELAQLIRREVKDPRVGLVTITAVEVSRDVGHAKIFITVMGQDSRDDIAQSIKVLNSAAGFLRSTCNVRMGKGILMPARCNSYQMFVRMASVMSLNAT